MKTVYSLIAILIFTGLSSTLKSETKTWIGPDGYWSDELKWSPEGLPTTTDDVIIPSGLTLDVDIDNAKCLTITVNDGATMDITGTLQVFDDSIFALGSIVDLVSGSIQCSNGATLTVVGQLNLTSEFEKKFTTGTVDIVGSLHIDGSGGELFIHSGCTLKISPTGIFSIDGDATISPQTWTNFFVNEGTVVKTAGSGSATFGGMTCTNNGGTISVESGSMDFNGQIDFLGESTINTSENTSLEFNDWVTVDGELSGVLNGPTSFNTHIKVDGESAGVLSFTGVMPLTWGGTGNLQGDKTLVNNSTIEIIGDNVLNASTLINYGVINQNSEENLTFGGQTALFENKPGSELNFNAAGGLDGYFGPNNLTNEGTINIAYGNGYHSFSPIITNMNEGIINTGDDGLQFDRFLGDGIFNVFGNFQVVYNSFTPFEGTMNIGGDEIQNITCTMNFYSSPDAIFGIQIDGPNAVTDHDVLAVDAAFVSLKGSFDIELGYAPEIDDEFEVMTFNDTLACDLPETVSSTFDGNEYTFEVICSDSNVILKVSDIAVGIEDVSHEFANLITYPNPTSRIFRLKFQNIVTEMNIVITDLLGNIVDVKQLQNTNTMDLNLEGASGLYFISLTDYNGLKKTIKVVKE